MTPGVVAGIGTYVCTHVHARASTCVCRNPRDLNLHPRMHMHALVNAHARPEHTYTHARPHTNMPLNASAHSHATGAEAEEGVYIKYIRIGEVNLALETNGCVPLCVLVFMCLCASGSLSCMR